MSSEMKKQLNNAQTFLQYSVYGLIIIAVIGVIFFPSINITGIATSIFVTWFPSIFTSLLLTAISSGFVESITGDSLKGIYLSKEIWGIKFSFSLFILATFLVKFILFK